MQTLARIVRSGTKIFDNNEVIDREEMFMDLGHVYLTQTAAIVKKVI